MNLDMQTINHWLKINSLNNNNDSAVEDVCVMKISAEIMLLSSEVVWYHDVTNAILKRNIVLRDQIVDFKTCGLNYKPE